MIPAPEGTPWWAWLIAVVCAAIPTLLGAVWAKARRTDQGVARIEEQVANTHTTNLRVDIDDLGDKLADVSTATTLTSDAVRRIERYMGDLDTSIRAIEHSIDRRDKIHAKAIDDLQSDLRSHLDDVPRIIDTTLAHYPLAHCPHTKTDPR